MSKTYMVNEIFYSLQGEGIRAGTANFFVRFAGCNLTCTKLDNPDPEDPSQHFDCDTEFASGRKMSAKEIYDFCRELNKDCDNIIFTGGEPALQLDKELVDYLHDKDMYLAIETNGTKEVDHLGLDWITVSPKVAEHAIRQVNASEVKYVRGYGQAIPKTRCMAAHQLISPAFDGTELDSKTLKWCIQLVRENPSWRLSVQQHKGWIVR